MTIEKYGRRFWAIYDTDKQLIAVCVYKKGAREVVRRLTGKEIDMPPRAQRKREGKHANGCDGHDPAHDDQ